MPEEQKTPYSSLPGNSNKAKSESEKPKKVEAVVTTQVVQRKKPLGKRLAESLSGDDARSVGQYLLFDVIVPSAKDMFLDLVNQGLERLLMGTSEGRSRIGGRTLGNRPGYSKMYSGSPGGISAFRPSADRPGAGSRDLSYKARATHDFDEIVMEKKTEADQVLFGLQELMNEYGQVTVSDLYALCNITGSYTDDKWGWTDLRGSKVDRIRAGWLLVLPSTQPLD